MFGKKKKTTERKVIVKTKQELKAAIKRKEPCIEVQGELANKMKWMGKLSKKKIAVLIALLAAAVANPIAGGGAAVGTLTVTHLTAQGAVSGSEAVLVVALISVVGGVTVLAILKGYNVEMEVGSAVVRLNRK